MPSSPRPSRKRCSISMLATPASPTTGTGRVQGRAAGRGMVDGAHAAAAVEQGQGNDRSVGRAAVPERGQVRHHGLGAGRRGLGRVPPQSEEWRAPRRRQTAPCPRNRRCGSGRWRPANFVKISDCAVPDESLDLVPCFHPTRTGARNHAGERPWKGPSFARPPLQLSSTIAHQNLPNLQLLPTHSVVHPNTRYSESAMKEQMS